MNKKLKQVPCGKSFVFKERTYLKCRSSIAQVVPILYQVLAVDLRTGEIVSFYEGIEITTVQ